MGDGQTSGYEVLWEKIRFLLGLSSFASFPLHAESDPPASTRLIDPHPLPDDRSLSSVASAHCAFVMFDAVWSGLVACGEWLADFRTLQNCFIRNGGSPS